MKYLFPCACVLGAIFMFLEPNRYLYGWWLFIIAVVTYFAALTQDLFN